MALGDVNGDGNLDFVAANAGGTTASVRLNNGTGNFTGGSDPAVGAAPLGVVLGDVDGDGDLDLLTAGSWGTVSVRLNNGSGTFAGGSDVPVGTRPAGLALGDVDGDGDLDLVAANYDPASTSVSVRLNNGAGTFAGGSNPAVGAQPYSVALGDVDGDGDLDLLAANVSSSTVSVRLNNGAGTFAGGSDPAAGPGAAGVVLADVDGDLDLDFVVTSYNGNTVSVRLNNGTTLATRSEALAATVGLYPNPAHGTFALAVPAGPLAAATATLRNVLGQVVQQRPLHMPAAGGTARFDVRGLAPGVYTLQLLSGETLVVKRVVLE